MSESKVFLQSFPYGLIVEIGDVLDVRTAPIYAGGKLTSRPFAYVMIVESDAARNEQLWRNEWYSYCARDLASEFLTNNLPFWLGRTHTPLYPKISPCKPFVPTSRMTIN
jgi:hypothetical protein